MEGKSSKRDSQANRSNQVVYDHNSWKANRVGTCFAKDLLAAILSILKTLFHTNAL